MLLSGTIRDNLDPFKRHVDGDIWEALDDVIILIMTSRLKNGYKIIDMATWIYN